MRRRDRLADLLVHLLQPPPDFRRASKRRQLGQRPLQFPARLEDRRDDRQPFVLHLLLDPPVGVRRIIDAGDRLPSADQVVKLPRLHRLPDPLLGERLPAHAGWLAVRKRRSRRHPRIVDSLVSRATPTNFERRDSTPPLRVSRATVGCDRRPVCRLAAVPTRVGCRGGRGRWGGLRTRRPARGGRRR